MLASIRRFTLLTSLSGLTFTVTPFAKADCRPVACKRYVGNAAIDNQCTDNDIQSAINISACPRTIYVSNERAWTGQHPDFNNRNITIVGRNAGCGPQACDGSGCIVPTTPEVLIDGAGHSGDSVMYIHGNSKVTLKSLELRNGNNINGAANTYDGGIHFDASGSLCRLCAFERRQHLARHGGRGVGTAKLRQRRRWKLSPRPEFPWHRLCPTDRRR